MMTPGPAPDAVAPAQVPDKRGTLVLPGPGRDVAPGLDGDDFSASDHLVGHRVALPAVVAPGAPPLRLDRVRLLARRLRQVG